MVAQGFKISDAARWSHMFEDWKWDPEGHIIPLRINTHASYQDLPRIPPQEMIQEGSWWDSWTTWTLLEQELQTFLLFESAISYVLFLPQRPTGQSASSGCVRIGKVTQTWSLLYIHVQTYSTANDLPVHDGARSPSSGEDQTSPGQLQNKQSQVKKEKEEQHFHGFLLI